MNTRFKIKAYLNFLIASKNQHGVHSPFVYKLITQCLYKRRAHKHYRLIKTAQKTTASTHKLPYKQHRLLNRLTRYFKPQVALNLSNNYTADIALALEAKTVLTSVNDAVKHTADTAQQNRLFKNIQPLSVQHPEKFIDLSVDKIDLAFIAPQSVNLSIQSAFKLLLNYAHPHSLYIFKGIHQSKETEADWTYVKAHKKVRVTIDIFFWGLVFFRTEQAKQHFTIRV